MADLRAPTPAAAAELAVPDKDELLARIGRLSQTMRAAVRNANDQRRRRLEALATRRCLSEPLYYVQERSIRLDHLTRALSLSAAAMLSRSNTRLGTLAGKLDAMSPLRVIARGYAVVSKHETPITSVAQVISGDPITLRMGDGRVFCTVNSTENEECVK